MSEYEKRQKAKREIRAYAKKASKTFSKDTTKTIKKAQEQVEQLYIPAFEVEA